ncbi:MAG: putative membrane protein [Pseudohongiellaceae bacterium]|jgi:uncharacterized membrane protein
MSKSKIILIALLASLALNLFFVGGILYRVATFQEFGPRPIPPNVSWIVRDLSEERQIELAPLMDKNRSNANIIRRQMFESQRRVNQQIASPDYNTAALAQAFTELRSIGLQYQELSHQQMLAILSELTTEERAIAREFMQRRGPRSGRQSREGREGRPPPPEFGGDQRRPPPQD